MHEHKLITVKVDQNPSTVTLSREVRTIEEVSLVYIRMFNLNMDNIPKELYIALDYFQSLPDDQAVVSSNLPLAGSGFGRSTQNMVPLHFKLGAVYLDESSTARQNKVLYGYQPEEMRWKAKNVSSMNTFRISLYDYNGRLYDFGASGTTVTLVFDAKWCPSQLQSMKWKTDPVYKNSMNA